VVIQYAMFAGLMCWCCAFGCPYGVFIVEE
jgi:hypothetical protein